MAFWNVLRSWLFGTFGVVTYFVGPFLLYLAYLLASGYHVGTFIGKVLLLAVLLAGTAVIFSDFKVGDTPWQTVKMLFAWGQRKFWTGGVLGVPIGVLTAVFLAEVAPKPLAAIVKPAVELLAGIPSVIYGLLGIYLLNPLMYKLERLIFQGSTTHQFTGGANLLSAVIVLAIMILPTVINISETSIRAVPAGIKSSSLALGASHVQTIFRSILPAAKSGIVTAIVLGVGRAIGEAMAITLVSGSSVNVPLPFNSVRFLTTAIVSEMGYSSGLHRQVLFTIGLVLFVFIMIINIVLNKILKKGADDNE